MFNGNKIKELLDERRLKQKDLLAHLGVKENGSIRRIIQSNMKASTLESIADFFCVSIDTFFVRDGNFENSGMIIVGDKNCNNEVSHGSASSRAREYLARCKSLESELKTKDQLLEERNRTIKILEEMVEMLRKQSLGQNSDK